MFRSALVLAAALVATPFVSGCKQGIGQRCQVDTDCQSNAFCKIVPNISIETGWTCQLGARVDGDSNDLATPNDAQSQD